MSAIDILVTDGLIERLGWTLLHFVWQGVVAATVLAIVLAATRSTSRRYVASFVTLLAMGAAPIVTYCVISRPVLNHATGVAGNPTAAVVAASAGTGMPAVARPATEDTFATMDQPARGSLSSWCAARIDWLGVHIAWVVGIWLSGVIVLSLRLAAGWLQIRRLRRRGTSAPAADWVERLAAIAGRLDVSRPVRLAQSALAESPMTMGWLRPVILLPAGALTGLAPSQIEAILAHELAHIRRHDYAINLVQAVIETMLFYHPAIWWVSHRMRVEREFCCDDIAIEACGDATVYARALADMETMRAMPGPALAASGGSLLERVARLMGRPATGLRYPWFTGLIVLAILAAAGALAQQSSRAESARYAPITPGMQSTNDVTGIVIDEQGAPIAGASVQAIDGNRGKLGTKTAADGRFSFAGLKPEGRWSFSADEPNHALMSDYEEQREVPVKPQDLPVTIKLYSPRTLTGTVVNEQGNPVAGARVVLLDQEIPGKDTPANYDSRPECTAQTDAQGRFELNRLRPWKLWLRLEHPDYAVTYVNPLVPDAKPARLTIETGLTLRGRVTAAGNPLEGVSMKAALGSSGRPVIDWHGKTDRNGEFSVPHLGRAARGVAVSIADPAWKAEIYILMGAIEPQHPPYLKFEAGLAKKGESVEPKIITIGDYPSEQAPQPKPGDQPIEYGDLKITLASPGEKGYMILGAIDENQKPLGSNQRSRQVAGGTTVERLQAGRYMVGCLQAGDAGPVHETKIVEVKGGRTTEANLKHGPVRISGVVTSGGKPVGHGHMSWFWKEPMPRNFYYVGGMYLPADGRYSLEGLPAGRHEIIYSDLARCVPHTYAVDANGTTTLNIELPTSRIEGRLIGVAPKPEEPGRKAWREKENIPKLGEIHVFRRDKYGPLNGHDGALVSPDAEGRFTAEHLPPGTYSVWGLDGYVRVDVKTSDSVAEVQLEPPRNPGMITGEIKGKDTGSQYTIRILIKDSLGYEEVNMPAYFTWLSGIPRTYSMNNLPAGKYAVLFDGNAGNFTNNHPELSMPSVLIPNVEVKEGLAVKVDIHIPEGRLVLLDFGNGKNPNAPKVRRWQIRYPTGDWLDSTFFFGNRIANENRFALPLGTYTVEANFGPAGLVTREFTVEKGEGEQTMTITPENH